MIKKKFFVKNFEAYILTSKLRNVGHDCNAFVGLTP